MEVELRGICKRFGAVEANRDVSLRLEPGAPHGLLGENGAGKSTLMKILSGFHRPDAGEILVDGRCAEIRSPADGVALGIGMLHQDPLDFPALRAWESFALGRAGPGARRAAMRAELASRAAEFGFELDPDAPVSTLTVGQRQQLEIVRLLSLGVRVLILDEPTTAISPAQRGKLFAALRRLAEGGCLIVLVSHKLGEANDLCGRATVMAEGRVAGERRLPAPEDELVRLMFKRAGHTVVRPPRKGGGGAEALRVRDLTVGDGRVTVRNASLAVRAGEIVGLAGVEGSGQRLFLDACSGRRRPWSGRVELIGETAVVHSPFDYRAFLRAGGGYLPAGRIEEGLVAGMTVGEHVALCFPARQQGIDWERVNADAGERIGRYDIRGRPWTPAGALSGGNQQRLLLALLPERLRVLLLEHPTRGLDVESAEYVWERLEARARSGTAILYASSDLDELLERSDRILVFFAGRTKAVERAALSGARLGGMIGGVGFD